MNRPPEPDFPDLPPPPERPDCCGSGCAICVLEIYQDELERWQAEVDALRRAAVEGRPAGPGA